MLFYVTGTTYFVLTTLLGEVMNSMQWFYKFSQRVTSFERFWNSSDFETLRSHSLILVAYLLLLGLASLMTLFLRFHIKLVRDNMTTIEYLGMEHNNLKGRQVEEDIPSYDAGVTHNW